MPSEDQPPAGVEFVDGRGRDPGLRLQKRNAVSRTYYVEVHETDGTRPIWGDSYDEFEAAFALAAAKAIEHPGTKVRLHLPSQASDEEHRRVAEAGWKPC